MLVALRVITTLSDQGVSYYNFYMGLNYQVGVHFGQNVTKTID